MKSLLVLAVLFVNCAVRAQFLSAAVDPLPVPEPDSGLPPFYHDWIEHRLEIGLRVRTYSMDQTQKGDSASETGTYFGTIDRLDPDGSNLALVFQYAISPYVKAGITWDQMVWTTRDGPAASDTDGDVRVESTLLFVSGQYPFDLDPLVLSPTLDIGLVHHNAHFEASREWSARGNSFHLDNEISYYLALGLNLQFTPHFAAHLQFRRMDYDLHGQWTRADGNYRPPTTIKADHDAWILGVSYTF